jgi:long-subunit acyl-CoA synthetase (AMP-forming)
VKLACSRWKLAYQSDIHHRYQDMTNTLEERYANEITKLLTEIQEVKIVLLETQKSVDLKEKEVLKAHEMVSGYYV